MIPLLLIPFLHAEEPVEVVDEVFEPVGPDRSAPPVVIPPQTLPLPDATVKQIHPGVTLSHLRIDGVRKVEVMVMFERGSLDLCGGPSAECSRLSSIWDLASEQTDAVAFESAMDSLDGSVLSWIGQTTSGLELTIPLTGLDAGMALLSEVLHTPGFPRDELKLSRENALDYFLNTAPSDLGDVASSTRSYGFYSPEHPSGPRPDLRAIKKVKRSDLFDLHARLLAESPIHILVVGDLPIEAIEPGVTALVEGLGVEGVRSKPPAYVSMGASSVVAVDMPGQTQAAIRVITEAPGRGQAERVPLSVINFAFGGSFTSRINANLREEKGWTYGAGSRYSTRQTHGYWSASVDVEAENVAGAVGEIRSEINELCEGGLTADEVEAAWLDEVTWWNRRLETAGTASGFYQKLILQEESVASVTARLGAARSLSDTALVDTAGAWLGADSVWMWVIVGDRSLIGDQVEGMGLPVQWITPEEAVMGEFEVAR